MFVARVFLLALMLSSPLIAVGQFGQFEVVKVAERAKR